MQIQPLNEELAKSMSFDGDKGALVAQVTPDSAAMAAGIKSGDVIKSVDGKDVESIKDLTRMISTMKPGTTAKIGLWRDGKDMTVMAKIRGDQKEEARHRQGQRRRHATASRSTRRPSRCPTACRWRRSPEEMREGMKLDDSVKGAAIAAVEPGSPADDDRPQAGRHPAAGRP